MAAADAYSLASSCVAREGEPAPAAPAGPRSVGVGGGPEGSVACTPGAAGATGTVGSAGARLTNLRLGGSRVAESTATSGMACNVGVCRGRRRPDGVWVGKAEDAAARSRKLAPRQVARRKVEEVGVCGVCGTVADGPTRRDGPTPGKPSVRECSGRRLRSDGADRSCDEVDQR